ncbi:RagB/SusD family nutrient uptake outer membrane protein [Bacteroides ovatus]|nr:RagB/SusD family nutrient uptake outer membrane protein [Bacteroides ovatus]
MDVGAAMSYCPRNRGGYASEYPSWELFCSFLCTDGLPIDESPLFDPQNPFKNRDPRCTATIVEFGTEHVGVIYNPNPNISRVWSAIAGKEITNLDCKTGSQYASYNGLLRKKGVDELWINDGTFKVDPDFVFIRYGEVLLTYAEAKIETNDIDQSVLDAINQVRARAYKKDYAAATGYPKVTTQDRDKLRQIVRIERRMELAFEGSIRYMDIIRWKLAEKVLNLPNYGLLDKDELINKVVNKNKWFFPYTPEIDEDGIADFTPMYNEGLIKIIVQRNFDTAKNYLLPIPSQEIITNPNLGQNDNY